MSARIAEGPDFGRVVERNGDTMVVGLIRFVTIVVFVLLGAGERDRLGQPSQA